jgi:cellulose synthase/poly-beta-1,6-N-acetylglucosamine synthase-like glycosyltransferase
VTVPDVLNCVLLLSLAAIAYPYAVYPLLLYLVSRVRPRYVRKGDITPAVSLIITVYNAGAHLGEKLDNSLAVGYPAGKLQIIVASDASDDGTDAVAAAYAGRGVQLCRAPARAGKTATQNLACAMDTGEILVFSDVTTRLAPEALRAIVRPFADPEVGLVSGEDVSYSPTDHAAAVGEGMYVRYEMQIRRLETLAGSLIGASGCFYAMRRHLRSQLPPELVEDFAAPLLVIRAGRRVVSEPDARAYVPTTRSLRAEFQRRVRIQIGGVVALWQFRGLLNPLRNPRLAWMLASHKLARWLVPMWLLVCLAANLLLVRHHQAYVPAALQAGLYLLALLGFALSGSGRAPAWALVPASFLLANSAIATGSVLALLGRRAAVWQPSARANATEVASP